jgi:hypothetical protein
VRVVLAIAITALVYVLFKVLIMRLKNGASLAGVSWQMFYAAVIAEGVFKKYGAAELVITAGTDGEHMEGSLHYEGRALDLRTWGINDLAACRDELKRKLGKNYDVVIEKTHLHMEYDPKA